MGNTLLIYPPYLADPYHAIYIVCKLRKNYITVRATLTTARSTPTNPPTHPPMHPSANPLIPSPPAPPPVPPSMVKSKAMRDTSAFPSPHLLIPSASPGNPLYPPRHPPQTAHKHDAQLRRERAAFSTGHQQREKVRRGGTRRLHLPYPRHRPRHASESREC